MKRIGYFYFFQYFYEFESNYDGLPCTHWLNGSYFISCAVLPFIAVIMIYKKTAKWSRRKLWSRPKATKYCAQRAEHVEIWLLIT